MTGKRMTKADYADALRRVHDTRTSLLLALDKALDFVKRHPDDPTCRRTIAEIDRAFDHVMRTYDGASYMDPDK
jgi:hypothetical protein